MTEIIIRNAVPTRAGNIEIVWDAARNDDADAVLINGEYYFVWHDYNYNSNYTLVGKTAFIDTTTTYYKRPSVYFNYQELYVTPQGSMSYYNSTYQNFSDVFIICQVNDNNSFGHILSFGGGYFNPVNTQIMSWAGVTLSIFHPVGDVHTFFYCRVGRNYTTVRVSNFDFNGLHTFSVENVGPYNQNVTFKWNNHVLCNVANIVKNTNGYTANNCVFWGNNAVYPQIGLGNITGFNLPYNSVLQTEQNGVRQCYAVGVGKITDNLMDMIYSRYNYTHVPLNINQTQTYTIDATFGTVFGTTTNFSGNMYIL